MAVGNRPLPNPQIDYGGFHNAASIEARAGEVSAQLLNQGFARAQGSIDQAVEGKKRRQNQRVLQEREFAERERGDLRQFSIAAMRQNAANARAAISLKKEEAARLQDSIAEDQYAGIDTTQKEQMLNQLTTQMGTMAAQGGEQLHMANIGEHSMGLPHGSIAPGGIPWSTLAPRTMGKTKPAPCPGGT